MTDSAARHGSVWMALHDNGWQTYVMKNTAGPLGREVVWGTAAGPFSAKESSVVAGCAVGRSAAFTF